MWIWKSITGTGKGVIRPQWKFPPGEAIIIMPDSVFDCFVILIAVGNFYLLLKSTQFSPKSKSEEIKKGKIIRNKP